MQYNNNFYKKIGFYLKKIAWRLVSTSGWVLLSLKRVIRWRVALPVFAALTFCLMAYCVHLNNIVVQKFEGPRFELPTRIYARPLELYPGKKWTKEHLVVELEKLNYQLVKNVSKPGEYADHTDYVVLYSRDFQNWDGFIASQWVRLTFANGFVSTLQDQQSGRDITQMRIEPLAFSGYGDSVHEDRKLVAHDEIPQSLIQALIATEDQRFFSHGGVDFRGLTRAVISTLSGRGVQGGSTITQQLVKNFYLTPERSLKRKFNELLMAVILDWRYSKEDILETYLNEVYFGQDGSRAIHGIELASQFYFGKSINQLATQESATLVALLKGPSFYNPRRHAQRATERRNLVLREMAEMNFISPEEVEALSATPLTVVTHSTVHNMQYPAFLDKVFREISEDFSATDIERRGLRIFTTLDPVLQELAEQELTQKLDTLEQQKQLPPQHLQAAMIITEPLTGKIAAMIGDRNVRYDGFNRVLDANRQVGSLMKPVVYLTALERPDQFNLVSLLDDSKLELEQPGQETWMPQNYDNKFHGAVPLWEALAKSYNIPTVRLGLQVGLDKVADTAKLLGASSSLAPYASSVLGAQEMTLKDIAQMYSSIAARGFHLPLHTVSAVVMAGDKLLLPKNRTVNYGISAQADYLVVRALQEAVREGTGRSLSRFISPQLNIAGKTGTTDDLRDSWFVGFNQQLLGAVWVGNDKNLPTELAGATGALQLWGSVFQRVGLQAYVPEIPKGVEEHYIHRLSGRRVSSRCNDGIQLPFIVGSEPSKQFGCSGSRPVAEESGGWLQRWFGG